MTRIAFQTLLPVGSKSYRLLDAHMLQAGIRESSYALCGIVIVHLDGS